MEKYEVKILKDAKDSDKMSMYQQEHQHSTSLRREYTGIHHDYNAARSDIGNPSLEDTNKAQEDHKNPGMSVLNLSIAYNLLLSIMMRSRPITLPPRRNSPSTARTSRIQH